MEIGAATGGEDAVPAQVRGRVAALVASLERALIGRTP